MIIKDWKKEIFSIPNLLSIFRLALIPVYVAIYLKACQSGDAAGFYLAAGVLAVSCLTDAIDGQIARRFNMITTVGKILDPLADKLTQFTMVICLSVRHPILWVLIVLIFVKEIFQLVAGILQFRKGKMLKGAQITGKICTTVLFLSLIIMVMIPQIDSTVVTWITAIDSLFLLIAFADYITVYLRKDNKFAILDERKQQD